MQDFQGYALLQGQGLPGGQIDRFIALPFQSPPPLGIEGTGRIFSPDQHRVHPIGFQSMQQAPAVVGVQVRYRYGIQPLIPSRHSRSQGPGGPDRIRSAVNQHLPPLRRNNQRAVALPHIKEMDMQFAIRPLKKAGPQIQNRRRQDDGGPGQSQVRPGRTRPAALGKAQRRRQRFPGDIDPKPAGQAPARSQAVDQQQSGNQQGVPG